MKAKLLLHEKFGFPDGAFAEIILWPINRLHFADTATLFKYLSPKRFELLQHLRSTGARSIRKLAAELQRDYKNVHSDVKDLLHVGLIEETSEGLLNVPWDVIVSELPLLAKAK